MSYLRKGNAVCDPAKKNGVIFQNSFQETYQSGTEQYQTGTRIITMADVCTCTQTGQYSYTIKNNSEYSFTYKEVDSTVRYMPAYGTINGGLPNNMRIWKVAEVPTYDTRPTYGTRTAWNIRWSKS